jgi:hypothetical protein
MMKRWNLLFYSVLFISFLFSCGPTKDDAINYNDRITDELNKVYSKYKSFYESSESINYSKPDFTKLDDAFSDYVKQIDESVQKVKEMKGFDGTTEMKDAALNFLNTCKSTSEKEWKDLIIFVKKATQATEDDAIKAKEIENNVEEKMNKVQDDFRKVQQKFSEKWKFKLQS